MSPLNRKMFSVFALSCAVAVALPACSFLNLFSPSPFRIDQTTDQYGREIAADTDWNWQWWLEVVATGVSDELAGKAPGGTFVNWNDYWVTYLRLRLPSGQENSLRYINCLLEVRKQKSLPPLVGFDLRLDEDGKPRLTDSDDNWRNWKTDTDRLLDKEARGEKAPVYGVWVDFWYQTLVEIEPTVQDNAGRYLSYFKAARASRGLPEYTIQMNEAGAIMNVLVAQ